MGLAIATGIVTYYGASQTITAGTYNNLVINQASGQASLGGNVIVNGILTLTNGVLNLSGFDLTLGPGSNNFGSLAISYPNDYCQWQSGD
jgi:hypothetical protein